MKLLFRLTAFVFLVLTAATSTVGYFAINKYQSSQVATIDTSLETKIAALTSSNQDPLSVMQYLAQVSAIPVSAAYLTNAHDFIPLTAVGPTFTSAPSTAEITAALVKPVDLANGLRIRAFAMPTDEFIVVAESTAGISHSVHVLAKDLIIFIAIVDLLGLAIALFFFRSDSKLIELSSLLKRKNENMQLFLGDASHELRTPLTVIKGYTELAHQGISLEQVKGYLAKTEPEILRMEKLIKDLLMLAELGEKPELHFTDVDVSQLVANQIQILKDINPQRSITTAMSQELVASVDEEIFTQAVRNIFANIKQHTPADAPVSVSLTKTRNRIELVVEDGGPGLPTDASGSQLFKRFDKSRSRESGGSGLGMSIIQAAISAHAGDLEFGRSDLGGLKISITLYLG